MSIAVLRCEHCGVPIEQKPKSKVPKYCVRCRQSLQEEYVKQQKNDNKQRR